MMTPLRARELLVTACTAAFAPTSMPFVGSSRMARPVARQPFRDDDLR
jgi:hypothetical protein